MMDLLVIKVIRTSHCSDGEKEEDEENVSRLLNKAIRKSHSFSMASTTRAMPSIFTLFLRFFVFASFFLSSSMDVIFLSTRDKKL